MATVSMAAVAPVGLVSPSVSNTVKASAVVKNVKAMIVCATAEEKKSFRENVGKVATALALVAIVGTTPFAVPENAMANVVGLMPYKESKDFSKREKTEIKKLEGGLKFYAKDSAPALAIKTIVERIKRRFAFYGDTRLLYGSDGLPHLIVDGDQAHLARCKS